MSNLNLQINWDFDSFSKGKFFHPKIESHYDLFFSLKNLSYAFYEIDPKNDITLSFSEADACESIFVKDLKFPFVYIKNVGECNLYVNASNSVNTFERSLIHKTSLIDDICSNDFLLKKNENVILTFCISQNGSRYFSKANFPFGFFYKFDNVKNINTSGLYPVCCYTEYGPEYIANKIFTGICEYQQQTFCSVDDYQFQFLDYYYCWQFNEFPDLIFYKKNISEIVDCSIAYFTGTLGYEYVENNLSLVSGDSTIDLNPILGVTLNCYYLYNNDFYDYNGSGFQCLVKNCFENSGFILSGEYYVKTEDLTCQFTFEYQTPYCDETYHPTYLYEDVDTNLLQQFNISGYSGFIHSYGFSGQVDSGANLIINFKNELVNLLDPIKAYSSNGYVEYCSNIYSNAHIENNTIPFLTESGSGFKQPNYSGIQLNTDCCINIFYRIFNTSDLYFKYNFENSDFLNSNCVKIYDSYGTFLCTALNLNEFCYAKESSLDSDAFIKFKLPAAASTSDINTKTLCRNSFTLPLCCDFDIEYCFELFNQNHGSEVCVSGGWSLLSEFEETRKKTNSLTIKSTGENYFIHNCPTFHCLNFNLNSTDVIFNTKISGSSEEFSVTELDTFCYFYVSGVEYKYTPLNYITYNGMEIQIPDCCININYDFKEKNLNFNFPLRALTTGQIYICSDLTFVNKYDNFDVKLNYKDLEINFSCNSLNQLKIPQIKNELFDCYEPPCLTLNFSSKKFVCEDYSITASLNNKYVDRDSDLYNFYIYIYSYFNMDTNCLCSLSGLKYNSDEYLFNFLKIERDVNILLGLESGICVPDEPCIFASGKFSGQYDCDSFYYKYCNNDLYNCASLLLCNINYCHVLYENTGKFEVSGILNNIHIAFNQYLNSKYCIISYSGNNKEDFCLLTGLICNDGYAQLGNCHHLIKLNYEKLTGASGEVNLSNEYFITGTQPFIIETNNPIENIGGNILYNNYVDYNLLCFKCNTGLFISKFYYTYDVNQNLENDLCFRVNCEFYIDSVNFCYPISCTIFNSEQNNETGIIYKNTLLLNYPFECIVSSNSIYCDSYQNFKINIASCL